MLARSAAASGCAMCRQSATKYAPAARHFARQRGTPPASGWVQRKHNGQTYWHCQISGETTMLGAARPTWLAVKEGNGLYWWSKQENATTAVGATR